MNSRLPEHCILKLLDASTQVLDFAAMQSESNSLYFAALGRCTGVRRLEMGQASDAHLIEAARLAPSLASLSMTIANSKVFFFFLLIFFFFAEEELGYFFKTFQAFAGRMFAYTLSCQDWWRCCQGRSD